jgi:predicted ATPase with chaperone activity
LPLAAAGHSNQEKTSMRLLMRPLAAAVLTGTWLLSVPAVNAQTQSPSPSSSEQSQTIPDQKLDAAAAAIEQVTSVKESYQQKIEAAAPSDKQRIADEGSKALADAVTGQGLSIEEYTSIIRVAQNNPEVRERILQRVRPPAK